MLQNTLANMAMAQAQEAQQRKRFAQQQASGNYGLDALGNTVNRQQRSSWNDRLTRFRNERGPATSQDLFNSIEGIQGQGGNAPIPAFNGGPDQFGSGIPQGRDNMAPGEWADPNGPGVGGYLGRGIQGLESGVNTGVAAFGSLVDKGLNSSYAASPLGRAVNGALGRPQATGYDITGGWNEDNDLGGNVNDGFAGDATGGMGANSGGVGGSRW